MLLPWPDFLGRQELRIFIHPRQIVLLRVKHGLKAAITDKHLLELPEGSNTWQAIISRLRSLLAEKRWQKVKTKVVLSNHFVRYAVIPFNPELSGTHELAAYTRHCFRLAYGDAANTWDLQMSRGGFSNPALASGVDSEFLQALKTEFKFSGNSLQAIYPHLMLSANQASALIKQGSAWLLSMESGRMTLGMIDRGLWVSVQSMNSEANIHAQLQAAIQRESIIRNRDSENWPVYCHWPEFSGRNPLVLHDRKVHLFDNTQWSASVTPINYRLALWG